MDEIRECLYEIRVEETVKNLIKHRFDTINLPDWYAACGEILNRVPLTKTVGFGGSITLREIGLVSLLEKRGNILYDHRKQGMAEEELLNIRKAQQSCDVYIR